MLEQVRQVSPVKFERVYPVEPVGIERKFGHRVTMYHVRTVAALLADAATLEGSGKVYIHGGAVGRIGTRQVPTPASPAVHANGIAVVVIFELGKEDAGAKLALVAELTDEDGQSVGTTTKGVLNVGDAPEDAVELSIPVYAPAIFPFPLLAFPHLGLYKFRVLANDEEIASLPLAVTLMEGEFEELTPQPE